MRSCVELVIRISQLKIELVFVELHSVASIVEYIERILARRARTLLCVYVKVSGIECGVITSYLACGIGYYIESEHNKRAHNAIAQSHGPNLVGR